VHTTFRFAVVGVVNTGLDVAIFMALTSFTISGRCGQILLATGSVRLIALSSIEIGHSEHPITGCGDVNLSTLRY
jgi:hypothetical protein